MSRGENYIGKENLFKDGLTIKDNGDKEWRLDGMLHREDGPAFEYAEGDKEWYLNGERHREDGPAIEYVCGNKAWYLNGGRHREDGPAIEYSNGTKEWYLKGTSVPEGLYIELIGDVKNLPLYIGRGFDEFIAERLRK